MKTFVGLCLTFAVLSAGALLNAAEKPAALDFKMKSLEGKEVDLARHKGKVVLIVNVASECGATPQYETLQQLYDANKDKGLVIIGVPCNQFGKQEPGSAKQIRQFCTANYGVTFEMLEKVDVKGPEAAPLYRFLTSPEASPQFAGDIRWNFEKFLISRDGQLVGRFRTGVQPDDEVLVKAVQKELQK